MEVDSPSLTASSMVPTSSSHTPVAAPSVIGLHYDLPAAAAASSNSNSNNDTLVNLLKHARRDGYQYITCRIPENITATTSIGSNTSSVVAANTATTAIISNANRNDYHSLTTMESYDWRTSIVGVLAFTPDVGAASVTQPINTTTTTTTTSTMNLMNRMIMTQIKDQLRAAIDWCLHLNIPAMIIPSLDTLISTLRTALSSSSSSPSQQEHVLTESEKYHIIRQYSNVLLSCLIHTNVRDLQIWIPHTMTNTTLHHQRNNYPGTLQYFYQLVDYHPSIRTLYTFSNMTTKGSNIPHCIQQIHLDVASLPPIAAVQIPTTLFITNKRGFPTLSRIHQHCIIQCYRRLGRNMKILLTQTTPKQLHEQLYSKLEPSQLGYTQLLPHCQYIQHLRSSKTEITSALDGASNDGTVTTKVASIRTLELEYNDVLQSPLQPLADHLENYTYEIFEHDPVKYVQYEQAIYHTMYDYYTQQYGSLSAVPTTIQVTNDISSLSTLSTSSGGMITFIPYIVLVVGAGRGPLVTCTMNAYNAVLDKINKSTKGLPLQLYIYAVEKNPNAILYLRSKFQSYIQNSNVPTTSASTSTALTTPSIQLQIVQSDLRYLNAKTLFQNIVQQHQHQQQQQELQSTTTPQSVATSSYKAHLIVSELLGSFGCNELSPECLDTLLYHTNVCSQTTTKSIPYYYTSHIAPIASMNLYHKVKQQALYPTCIHSTQQQMVGLLKAFETPYVVRPHMVSQIYATQDCWSFTHEPWNHTIVASSNIDLHKELERHVHLEFSTNENDGTSMYGAQYGTGYGPCDEYVQSMMQAMMDNNSSRNKNTTSMSSEPQPEPQSSSLSSWTCTGLLGTFTADLYQPSNSNGNARNSSHTIQISTNPDTFSTGMFSWFPLYFPCLQPIHVPEYGVIHIDIWRKCSSTKVWYEWMFTVLVESPPPPPPPIPRGSNHWIPRDNHDMSTEMDHDPADMDSSTGHIPQQMTVHYVSPIHNPGGRSSYVSLLS
jgi:PRMT5 arginine-N-methyltransferase/PRMT5 oligomerisation domain/PRMT5 TIM barrel domain